MNAGYVVYAFLGEVVFAVIAAGAVLILAALLRVTPLKVLRRRISGSQGEIQIVAIDRVDPIDRLEPKIPVIEGMQTPANGHGDAPLAAAVIRTSDMQPHM
jgi:hypothetical protein